MELKGLSLVTVKALDYLYRLEKELFKNDVKNNNKLYFRGVGIENLDNVLNSDEVPLLLDNKLEGDKGKMFFSNNLLYPFVMPKLINQSDFKGWLILVCNLDNYEVCKRLKINNYYVDVKDCMTVNMLKILNIDNAEKIFNECNEFFMMKNLQCKDILRMYAVEVKADTESFNTEIYLRVNNEFYKL